MRDNLPCPVCGCACSLLDVVDFNKTCLDVQGISLAGIPIYYALCENCQFCFAPEIADWSIADFEEKIYNQDYILVDPEYVEVRPRSNAATILSMFREAGLTLRHLDYGAGSGVLSNILNEANFQSVSYDPFVDRQVNISQLGTFDLITAFEVFEHVPDVPQLMTNLLSLLAPDGIVLFSTLLSDGHIQTRKRINWWYASPRNGHISLFSKKSLSLLAYRYGLNFGSFSEGFHVYFTSVPPWAGHLIH
jgi:SAM-dependent methyltransferase